MSQKQKGERRYVVLEQSENKKNKRTVKSPKKKGRD